MTEEWVTIETSFILFAIVLAAAAGLGILAIRFKQPLILAFIAVGIAFNVVNNTFAQQAEFVDFISEIAIALLLFTVGLKLDMDELKSSGKTALTVAVVQMIAVALLGFIASRLLGFALMDSLYIALAVSFSSTIVVIKVLSDKGDLESLQGRIAIGILIVQDITVIIVMLIITAIGQSNDISASATVLSVVKTFGFGLLFVVAAILAGRFILPSLMQRVAESSELLILFGMAWAVALAAVGEATGLGKELGAFIAGLSLAASPFKDTLLSRLTPLRDFMLTFFFVSLGLQLNLNDASNLLPAALFISFIIILGTPFIVTWVMGRMGYHRMTGFLTGLAVSQISEFSLIICSLGISYGQIGNDTLSVITMASIITIVSSTYLMRYDNLIYRKLATILTPLQKTGKIARDDTHTITDFIPEIMIFGMGSYGSRIADNLNDIGIRVLGVDFDPIVVKHQQSDLRQYRYGDVSDPELGSYLPIATAKVIIATLPDAEETIQLVRTLRQSDFDGVFFASGKTNSAIKKLRDAGVLHILRPFNDAADQAVDLISAYCTKVDTCDVFNDYD